ncbi:MAG: sulfatase family protein, partial [Planctomycetota bacterium]
MRSALIRQRHVATRTSPRRIAWTVWLAVILLSNLGPALAAPRSDNRPPRPNVLLLTADDLGYGSLGVTGCTIPGITPHLDRLAASGLRFEHAYVTVAVCQPCRQVLMTGRYPHRFGALGFEPIDEGVPTLQESLSAAGYFNGILGKDEHLQPQHKFCWDVVLPTSYARNGRDANVYHRHAARFFQRANNLKRPFFLMADAVDPHRPFPRTAQEKRAEANWCIRHPPADTFYPPETVPVPRFLPDLPEIREELAAYYAAVHRCDQVIGGVLRALEESGMAENTLLMFLGDHGMAFPFGKSNCYRHSTRTAWIVRWPGFVEPNTVDREHFISGIDYTPTILDAVGLPEIDGVDGRSFLPVLTGGKQAGRRQVFTVYNRSPGNRDYPMRCLENDRFGYIFNAWSDGQTQYRNSAGGASLSAMKRAARSDSRIEVRVHLFEYRVREEF